MRDDTVCCGSGRRLYGAQEIDLGELTVVRLPKAPDPGRHEDAKGGGPQRAGVGAGQGWHRSGVN
jgi:hypothetical protein